MNAETRDKAIGDRIRHATKKAKKINLAMTKLSEKIKPGQYKVPPKIKGLTSQ